MYDALVRSAIFGVRNADKVANTNDKGRILADVGQFTNAAKTAAQLDNAIGKGAQAAISAMGKVAESNKALNVAAKSANWAANHVNPLLVGAAGYRVYIADDKELALKREVLGMTSMFAVEGAMKEVFKSNKIENFRNKIPNKYAKTALGVAEGVIFVLGSIAGSSVGYKVGDKLFNKKNQNVTETKPAESQKSVTENKSDKSSDGYEKEFYVPGSNKELIG